MEKELIISLYESDKDIVTLSRLSGLDQRTVLLIRIGKIGAGHTKHCISGMKALRTRLKYHKSRFAPIELEYIKNSAESNTVLADRFGVSKTTIYDIKHDRATQQAELKLACA